jgi:hypothetical protein
MAGCKWNIMPDLLVQQAARKDAPPLAIGELALKGLFG